MQDVKWDNCKEPYPSQGGNCTPDRFPGGHNYTPGSVDATMHAALVEGGIDYNCGPLYKTNLYSVLQRGGVSHADIDQAAGRIYSTMIKLGMLDPMEGQAYTTIPPEAVDSAASRAAALNAAEESMVLLKNEGSLLPLRVPTVKVAFIGPHANSTQALLSNYHGTNTLVDSHSPLQSAIAAGMQVTYAKGCNICDVVPAGFPNMYDANRLSIASLVPLLLFL